MGVGWGVPTTFRVDCGYQKLFAEGVPTAFHGVGGGSFARPPPVRGTTQNSEESLDTVQALSL